MLLNTGNLASLRTGYSASMQKGQTMAAKPQADKIATRVKATQKEQKYGWLGKMPDVREWIGDRVVQNIAEHDYAIREKKFELTLAVDRDDIETDNNDIFDDAANAVLLQNAWESHLGYSAEWRGGVARTCSFRLCSS